jgi:hypothetical protein
MTHFLFVPTVNNSVLSEWPRGQVVYKCRTWSSYLACRIFWRRVCCQFAQQKHFGVLKWRQMSTRKKIHDGFAGGACCAGVLRGQPSGQLAQLAQRQHFGCRTWRSCVAGAAKTIRMASRTASRTGLADSLAESRGWLGQCHASVHSTTMS